MRSIFIIFLIIILPVTTLFAAPETPGKSVWITPPTAKVGDDIQLNAFIYNNTQKDVTAIVVFKNGISEIGNTSVSVEAQAAKTATISWTMPKDETVILASVTKVLDVNKKAVPELVGSVGSITLNGKVSILPTSGVFKRWFGALLDIIEPFRVKQAAYFINLRDSARIRAGITVGEDIGKLLVPNKPETPAVSGEPERIGSIDSARELHLGAYFTLIYATALAALFSKIAIFYISLVLVTLLIIRFIFGRFSR